MAMIMQRDYEKFRNAENKTKLWFAVREVLLEEAHNLTGNCGESAWCEKCRRKYGEVYGLGWAHRVKRRKLPHWKRDFEGHVDELFIAAYLCTGCHSELEHGPPDIMYDAITELSNARYR